MTVPKTFGEYSAGCPDRIDLGVERRPANALNVEIGQPMPRCQQQSPDGRGLAWLWSGGSPLAYGQCCRSACPLLIERDNVLAMAKFDEAVTAVAERIGAGHVLLSERVREGKRRSISVGPHRTATSTKRQYGMIVLPALPGENDIYAWPGANRAAREFVRLVGVDEAQNALTREARKRLG